MKKTSAWETVAAKKAKQSYNFEVLKLDIQWYLNTKLSNLEKRFWMNGISFGKKSRYKPLSFLLYSISFRWFDLEEKDNEDVKNIVI